MIGFREIESSLQNERHFTGESYIALFQGDVRDNAKRFFAFAEMQFLCCDTLVSKHQGVTTNRPY